MFPLVTVNSTLVAKDEQVIFLAFYTILNYRSAAGGDTRIWLHAGAIYSLKNRMKDSAMIYFIY